LRSFPQDGKEATVSIKAYKYRIDANKTTTEKLQWVLDRCRELVRHFWRLFDTFMMKERLGAHDL
jgi:hypothetical protein